MPKRANDAYLRNRRQTKQLRLYSRPKKRKMPPQGTKITVIHDGTYDLGRIKEIIERYGLKVRFRKVEK